VITVDWIALPPDLVREDAHRDVIVLPVKDNSLEDVDDPERSIVATPGLIDKGL
jgi:hypothetical protein